MLLQTHIHAIYTLGLMLSQGIGLLSFVTFLCVCSPGRPIQDAPLLRVMVLMAQEGPGPGQHTLLFVLQPIRIMVYSLSEAGSPSGDSGDTQVSRACISVGLVGLLVSFWMETTPALSDRLDKRLWGRNIFLAAGTPT